MKTRNSTHQDKTAAVNILLIDPAERLSGHFDKYVVLESVLKNHVTPKGKTGDK